MKIKIKCELYNELGSKVCGIGEIINGYLDDELDIIFLPDRIVDGKVTVLPTCYEMIIYEVITHDKKV